MTIIQPHARGTHTQLFLFSISALSALLVAAIFLVLFWYNQIVNLNHEIGSRREALKETQARNADLKQSVYTMLSYENLERVALLRNLVKEKNPEFIRERPTDLSQR